MATTPLPIFKNSLLPKREIGGVYAIINSDNLKVYVGSSIRIRNRVNSHKCATRVGKSHNRFLHRAILKSPNSFELSLIEEVSDPNSLLQREQFWIDFYQSFNPEFGYNIAPIAGNCIGVKHSPEVVEKSASTRRGRKQSREHVRKMADAHRGMKYKINRTPEYLERMRQMRLNQTISKETMRKIIETRRIRKIKWVPVIQMDASGNELRRFDSMREASKEIIGNHTASSSIGAVCRKVRSMSIGYRWKYA